MLIPKEASGPDRLSWQGEGTWTSFSLVGVKAAGHLLLIPAHIPHSEYHLLSQPPYRNPVDSPGDLPHACSAATMPALQLQKMEQIHIKNTAITGNADTNPTGRK